MSYLILEHLTHHDLPTQWANQLPVEPTFSVMIVTEKPTSPFVNSEPTATGTPLFGMWRDYDIGDVDKYVRQMRRGQFDTR